MYSLKLIGPFGVFVSGIALPISPSAQRLLALLGIRSRGARTEVAGILWPEVADGKALASLRTLLWRLQGRVRGLVDVNGEMISLAPGVEVDLDKQISVAHRLLAGQAEAPVFATAQLEWGELLPGWYDDWVLVERERLRQLHMHFLEAMSGKLTELGRYAEAIDAALVAINMDPLRASPHRSLILAYLAEGNKVEAVRQFKRLRKLLDDELGVEPPEYLATLVRAG